MQQKKMKNVIIPIEYGKVNSVYGVDGDLNLLIPDNSVYEREL